MELVVTVWCQGSLYFTILPSAVAACVFSKKRCHISGDGADVTTLWNLMLLDAFHHLIRYFDLYLIHVYIFYYENTLNWYVEIIMQESPIGVWAISYITRP